MERKQIYRALLWSVSVLGILIFIFSNSLMPAPVSDGESASVFSFVSRLFPFLTHHLVRKLAHFSEYALLGAAMSFLPLLFQRRMGLSLALALAFGPVIALLDEGLQRLVPGRAGVLTDVLIDTGGYLCGFLLFFAVSIAILKLRRTHHAK